MVSWAKRLGRWDNLNISKPITAQKNIWNILDVYVCVYLHGAWDSSLIEDCIHLFEPIGIYPFLALFTTGQQIFGCWNLLKQCCRRDVSVDTMIIPFKQHHKMSSICLIFSFCLRKVSNEKTGCTTLCQVAASGFQAPFLFNVDLPIDHPMGSAT